jgi:4-hydroxy-2-oxoheptanedioate aldolase
MKQGPVYGITCYTGAACAVEAIGGWGFDFVYLDLEHSSIDGLCNMERLILSALHAGVSRWYVPVESTTQKSDSCWKWARGSRRPALSDKEDVLEILKNAKFPPMGRRGGESNVRAAAYGTKGFSWSAYTKKSNEDTLVIPMDEDYEFSENIQEILDVPGIDAINFGPVDYALSVGAEVGYQAKDTRVQDAYALLAREAGKRSIGIMAPVVPSAAPDLKAAIGRGINMLILGNDMHHLQTALKSLRKEIESI